MKGIVIYDSKYGNTKIIGEIITETLKDAGLDVDLSYVNDVKQLNAGDYDFLVLGSPTKMNNMSFSIRFFIGALIKGEGWKDKPFATFDTELLSVVEKGGGSAAERMADLLSKKGLKQVLPVLKTSVLEIKGPLKEGEIENTKEYARELALKFKGE